MTDRLWFLATILAALYVIFIGRLFHLQVVQGSHYAQLVEQSRLVSEVLAPQRGRIVDRTGTPIADTRAVYNLGVTFSELELRGRARRELPFFRLDEKRFAAFIADLAGRVRLSGPTVSLREAVVREFLNHPGVAVRSGSNGLEVRLGLVALPRLALQPQLSSNRDADSTSVADMAQLAESDLLSDDPREALEHEIAIAWSKEVTIVGEDEFQAMCLRFDQEMATDEPAGDTGSQEHSLTILDPFTPTFALHVPDGFDAANNLTAVDLAVRILVPERRAQAEATLARVLGESQPLVHERLERALQASRIPRHSKELYYGARSQAERIAPMLPEGQVLSEIAVEDVPGARERVLIVQGDSPDGEGLCGQICRRIAANLGTDGDLVEALLTKHAERIRAITCERDYRVHHMAIDPVLLDRLASGLAQALSGMGRPTSTLDIDSALAKVRRSVDREWTGKTRFDALSLIPDIPHTLAVRLQDGNSQAPRDLLADFSDAVAQLPGLVVQVDVGRSYPFPGSCCHFLGTLGHNDIEHDGDDRTGLLPGSLSGVSGLEQIYEVQLRGVAGERVRVRTPDGGMRTLRDEAAKPGVDVVTQLDMELQSMAEDSLDHYYELAQQLGSATDVMDKARAVGRGRGGFCLIDCNTGGILALASAPRFRIEDLRTQYHQLEADPSEPLLDHASVPEMPPGSCFKILTALCCLEHEVIQPDEEIYCQGFMAMSHGKKVLRDHAPAGTYDLPHAIQVSSNVYFATIGARLKPDWLCDYAREIGLGRRNAADVWEQKPGILPTPKMLSHMRDRVAAHETKWMTSDSWRMAIGQFATASPLQCVAIAAAVANGGHIVQPFLVKPVDPGGLPHDGPPVVRDLSVRKEYLDQVRLGMELVTENEPHATGRLLVLEGDAAGIKVAAKTGTSEAGGNEELHPDNAWMIGYAPADNPTVAFACFIHSGTFGGAACTPVVKRVLEAYFKKYGRGGHAQPNPLPPHQEPAAADPAAAPASSNDP